MNSRKGDQTMPANSTKLVRFLSISILIALLLTSPYCLGLLPVVHAGNSYDPSAEQKADKVSPLLKGNKHRADETLTVIVALSAPKSGRLNAFLNQTGIHQRRELKSQNSFSLSLPYRMVAELASFPEVMHVSSNEPVQTLGHVSATIGADAGQAAAVAAGRGSIDGSGIGIAILDSGIDVNHAQFAGAGGGSRVVTSVDFTGENRTDDPYGHGTFVAAAAAGGTGAGASYRGIAPGVSLLNVRVLDSTGNGSVEN